MITNSNNKNFSFNLQKGDFVGIKGKVDGKSTLIDILIGLTWKLENLS